MSETSMQAEADVEMDIEEFVVEETSTSLTVGYGAVEVVIDGALSLPERAGKLSIAEVKRIPRPPRGLGLACENAADSLSKATAAGFVAPPGVTPESLRKAGEQAEAIDVYIRDAEVLLNLLKQGNLMLDAAAYEELRKLNDQVKAQAKYAPEMNRIFAPLLSFFDLNGRRGRK